MADCYELDIEDLLDNLTENVQEDCKDFGDIVNLEGCLRREVYLADIVEGTGTAIDGYIRFWNHYDDNNNIPIEDREPIKLYINSQGGSLSETFTMISSIKMSKTPVWTINIGCAYSGGFFTFIAGHERYAYPTASFLYHEGSVGQAADAGKFRNFADFYNKELEKLKDIVLENTDITPEQYKEHIKDDWWLTAQEALELGVCDYITEEFI